jgi:hypothetical protein
MSSVLQYYTTLQEKTTYTKNFNSPDRDPFKGIVSPDWKGLQMVSLDRFEV